MASTTTVEGIQFERAIGAPADTKELEYVSALHQTTQEALRTNGTIQAKDIRDYLTSRHGVRAKPSVIEKYILKELCGTMTADEYDDEDAVQVEPTAMDLCQMVALLCIPFLRQEDLNEAQKPTNSLNHGMAEQVLKLILEELELNKVDLSQFRAVDENFETGTRITPRLIQCMLDTYGEYHVPDEVLEEMVRMAGGKTNDDDDEEMQDSTPRLKTKKKTNGVVVMWNKDSFQRALTADVQLYQPSFEHRVTTHAADVLSTPTGANKVSMESGFYTAPSIDHGADNYRSYVWTMLLWITFLFFYMCYMFDSSGVVQFTSCESEFGCQAASAVVNWLAVLAQFGVFGVLYVYMGSWGNSSTCTEIGSHKCSVVWGVLVAMGVVACATIVPNFIEGEVFVWNTIKEDGWEALYWTCFGLGVMLIMIQFIRFLDNLVPLGAFGAGGRTRIEQCIKEAATKKVNVMIENAMLLHVFPILAGEKPKLRRGLKFPVKHASPIVVKLAADLHDEKYNKKDHYQDASNLEALTGGDGSERALRHYKAMRDVTETTGGVLWAYQRMADGRLFDEEGIWISARLITSNVIQWLVVVAVVVIYSVALAWFQEQKDNTVAVGQRRMEEGTSQQQDALRKYVAEFEHALQEKRQQHRHHPHPCHWFRRRLQYVESFNSTHYNTTGDPNVYPNIIYDFNTTHFTDGTSVWPYATNSHNGTHVFDKYFPHNSTHFTDGTRYYPFSEFATNGTHITNGEYLFDGTTITAVSGNTAVNNVEDWEFKAGLSSGLVAALLATIGIAVVYIPSFVSTVLKFRAGFFLSLKGRESFQQLRESPDRATTLLGSAMWGSLFTAFFCALFVGGVVFLSVWSETRSVALSIWALLIGLLAIFLVKVLVVKLFRDLYVTGFYRRHPAAVNFLNVLLESWNLALAIGSMLLRSAKLLVVTAIYIGRIDVPTFAPGVGHVGPFALDSEHFSFKNDLLIHEAHRHPYMERLGMMYLMKLHHGSSFGSRAGAYWRMLFVLALMPWLRAYRTKPQGDKKPDRDDADAEDDFVSEPTEIDDGSVMSLHGMGLEIDVVKRANDSLTRRNQDLKQAVENLRSRLRGANKQVAQLERRVERQKAKSGNSKKPGPSSLDGTSEPKKDDNPAEAQVVEEQPIEEVEEVDDDVEDETFESESEAKSGPVSVQSLNSVSRDDFEDESQSDEEEDTFSQVVSKEREKLEAQRRQSDLRTDPKNGPVSLASSFVSADDEWESDDEDDEPLEEVLRKRSNNTDPQSEEPPADLDEEFEDEFETEEEESLAHLLKKRNDKRTTRGRAPSVFPKSGTRDPD